MVRLDEAALAGMPPAAASHLRSYGTVDRYLTSPQDHLRSVLEQGSQEGDVAQQAHAALLAHLQGATPRMHDGTQLFAHIESCRMLPTGCASVDHLLGGGVRETSVTEVAGETCSGKTQLCHLATALSAARGERVVYFDTTNAFSAALVRQMANPGSDEEAFAMLSNVSVVRVHSIHGLLSSLDELALQAGGVRPSLVVVDSISAVLSPVVGGAQHNQGHVLVTEVGRLLRHVAEALHCAVLVTNHVVGAGGRGGGDAASSHGGVSSGFKPALGEQWRGVAHVRLQLSHSSGGGNADVIVATLLSHSIAAPGMQARFRLGPQMQTVP